MLGPRVASTQMHNFTNCTEDDFRAWHDDVHKRACGCYNLMADDSCQNTCHYLISEDLDSHLPAVFGIDCEVSVLCCGGDDIDNSTIVAYCRDCSEARNRDKREQRLRAQAEYEQHREMEQRRLEAERQRMRALRDFWVSLSDRDFERECSKLFIRLGFASQTTSVNNDGAIDILLQKDGKRGGAQCKAWAQPCGVTELREFYGAMHAEGMTFGYFIARGGITRSARLLLQKMPLLQCWTLDDILHHATAVA